MQGTFVETMLERGGTIFGTIYWRSYFFRTWHGNVWANIYAPFSYPRDTS